ncbi:MAG: ParB N-terminal domain-containing protein [Oscillospiraceae bacterium]|nr:ParB N-terminal domain-containing protein [Oscillospiraceae bacterium]
MVKVEISRIKIAERIRKDIINIEELAADIQQNGLINPVTVMPFSGTEDGEYQLLAGLRRIMALQSLGWNEVDVNVLTPNDAEKMLRIEIGENEQRVEFTESEKLDYGRQLERLESVKALERKAIGGKGGFTEDTDPGPYLKRGETRNIVGKALNMSGKQYDRLKYIDENAPPEVMKKIDSGELKIRPVYDELRAKEKAKLSPPIPVTIPVVMPPKPAEEPSEKEYKPPEDTDFLSKYAEASHRCDVLETLIHNERVQWEAERSGKNAMIESLQAQIEKLESALDTAHAKIHELGGTV